MCASLDGARVIDYPPQTRRPSCFCHLIGDEHDGLPRDTKAPQTGNGFLLERVPVHDPQCLPSPPPQNQDTHAMPWHVGLLCGLSVLAGAERVHPHRRPRITGRGGSSEDKLPGLCRPLGQVWIF